MWTLRYGDEVRKEEAYFEDIDEKADPEMLPLIVKLIEQQRKPWTPDMVRDPVQEKLLEIIEKKRKATKPVKAAKPKGGAEPAERGNIIDLMSALKQSLEGKKPGRKAS